MDRQSSKKSATFRLSLETRERLKEQAAATGLAQAEIIEQLVQKYEVEVRVSERAGV